MAKKTRITHCQVLYAMGRASGLSPRKAAEAAGYTNVTRRRIWQLENSQVLQEYIEEHLVAQGVTMERVAQTLAEGLGATKVDNFCTRAGVIVQTVPMIDYQTRHKYVQTIISLLGLTGRAQETMAAVAGQSRMDLLAVAERGAHLSDEDLTVMLQKLLLGTHGPPAVPLPGIGSPEAERPA